MSSGPSFILSFAKVSCLLFGLISPLLWFSIFILISFVQTLIFLFILSFDSQHFCSETYLFFVIFIFSIQTLISFILTPMSFVLTLIDIVLIPFSVFWHSSPHPCSSLSYVLFLISFPFFSYHLCLFLVVYGLKQVFTSSMTMSRVRWVVTVCCSWVSVRLMPWHLTLVFLGDQMETNKTKSLPHCFDNGPLLELINHVHVW